MADIRIDDMDFTVPPWDKRMSTRVKNKLQRNEIMTRDQLMRCDLDALKEPLGIVERTIVLKKMLEFIDPQHDDPTQ